MHSEYAKELSVFTIFVAGFHFYSMLNVQNPNENIFLINKI